MLTTVDHPTYGNLTVFGNPLGLRGSPPSIRSAPPRLGEHTFEILRRHLGLGEQSLTTLEQDGVIAQLSFEQLGDG